MRWKVIGADAETGEDKTLNVDADSEEVACQRANADGIFVAEIIPIVRATARPLLAAALPIADLEEPLETGWNPPSLALGRVPTIEPARQIVKVNQSPFIELRRERAGRKKMKLGLVALGLGIAGLAAVGAAALFGFGAHAVANARTSTGSPLSFPTSRPVLPGPGGTVSIGDFDVRLQSARIGVVDFRDSTGEKFAGSTKYLQIGLAIVNRSANLKHDYRTWGDIGFPGGPASLTDEKGNDYKRITFDLYKLDSRMDRQSVYPKKEVDDVLVFEVPVEGASKLYLNLPGGNVEGDGVAKFQVPISSLRAD